MRTDSSLRILKYNQSPRRCHDGSSHVVDNAGTGSVVEVCVLYTAAMTAICAMPLATSAPQPSVESANTEASVRAVARTGDSCMPVSDGWRNKILLVSYRLSGVCLTLMAQRAALMCRLYITDRPVSEPG